MARLVRVKAHTRNGRRVKAHTRTPGGGGQDMSRAMRAEQAFKRNPAPRGNVNLGGFVSRSGREHVISTGFRGLHVSSGGRSRQITKGFPGLAIPGSRELRRHRRRRGL
jgi:hypothetical protein